MKTKKIKYFFLALAMMLAFGHSVMPHTHHIGSQTTFQKWEVTGPSLIDIIKTGLAHNVGLNHLEDYQNGKKLAFTSAEDLVLGLIKINDNINFGCLTEEQFVYSYTHLFNRRLAANALLLRGPPTC
jgi:hypothetical protein